LLKVKKKLLHSATFRNTMIVYRKDEQMKKSGPPVDPNPRHGERGAFRKLTVTVPPEIFQRLVEESARRKIAGEANHVLSAVVREALTFFLERERK